MYPQLNQTIGLPPDLLECLLNVCVGGEEHNKNTNVETFQLHRKRRVEEVKSLMGNTLREKKEKVHFRDPLKFYIKY